MNGLKPNKYGKGFGRSAQGSSVVHLKCVVPNGGANCKAKAEAENKVHVTKREYRDERAREALGQGHAKKNLSREIHQKEREMKNPE
jgi:hypothetical protein